MRNNDTLARNVLESIGDAGQITRKYYQRRLPSDPSKDYYYIMRDTGNVTPLLIEYGFIDTPADVKKLQNNLLDYVEAVVKAVTNYIGVQYVSPSGEAEEYYIVQPGDSLWSIANKFDTTVAILRDLNNLTSDVLQVGQRIILPTYEPPSSGNTYTVKSGDSLWSIANQFNVSVDDLISANNLTSTVLQVGDVLTIPGGTNQPEQGYTTYTVKSGDSLWLIANRYDTTVDAIKNLNNLTSNTLQIGQVLKIPTTSGGTNQPEQGYTTYTVKSGDSLWLIANRYDTTVDAIKSLNNLTSNTLQIGQVLRIPTASGGTNQPGENYITYTVKNGDSLWKIANQYNTTVNEIRQLNNLSSNILQIGQVLRIPA